MDVKILFFVDQKKEREFVFTGERMEIGRAATCNLMVNDPMVSSRHLAIFRKDGQIFVEDTQSINGTFLHGQPVTEPTPLMNQDEISFCNYKIIVVMEGTGSASQRQPVQELSGKQTLMINREDLEGIKGKKLPLNMTKKQLILAASAAGMLLILLILILIPTGGNTAGSGEAPLRAGMLDTYFLELERKTRDGMDNRNNVEQAKEYYQLGEERLRLTKLNREAEFQALLYLYKAKFSMLEADPRPALWDEVNPKIAQTEQSLKERLRMLFQNAWLSEKDGDRQGAISLYQTIQETLPDEASLIYRTASFRITKLQ